MRVVVNTNVTPSSATGVGQYIEQLLGALAGAAPDIDLALLVYAGDPAILTLPAVPHIGLPFRPDQSYRHIPYQPYVMRRVRQLRADVYHVPNTSPLLFSTCPAVVTIHDLQEFYIPKYGQARSFYRKMVNAIAAHRADAVITVSEFSRSIIARRLRVPATKVQAVPNGLHPGFAPSPQLCPPVEPPYIISVGQLQPGKNYARLLDAFAGAETHGHRLVIVGSRGWGYEALFARATRPDLAGRVIFLENVALTDLVALYSHATLCVVPSLFEGFGFPVLESMACGTPVLAAGNSSLPEVGGDAARYFDPYSTIQIRHAIERALGNPDLRSTMRERGLRRALLFSWAQAARATADIYRRLAAAA